VNSAKAYLRDRGFDDVRAAFAPGRINLIGEHTDYNGGFVLPAAIDLGVHAAVVTSPDRQLVMRSLQVPDDVVAIDIDRLEPGSCHGWSAYVAGAVWALLDGASASSGLEIAIDGNVPLGAGLSSSAALECAVLVACANLWDLDLSPRELARRAQRAENEFVGVPTGSMDQVASMMSVRGAALFYDVREDRIEPVPLSLEAHGLALVVIDTHAAHELVDGGYADRRATCELAAELLNVEFLRDVTDLDAAMQVLSKEADAQRLIARTRHVVAENARVLAAIEALERSDYPALGDLLTRSHSSLRDDYEVSCLELDVAVDASLAAGALGARMMGGGFGGSALALIASSELSELRSAVFTAYEGRGLRAPTVIEVEPGPGACVM
jgi:galactokinase